MSKILALLLVFSMVFNLLPLVNAQEAGEDAKIRQIAGVKEIVDGRFMTYMDDKYTKEMDSVLDGNYQKDVVSYLRYNSAEDYNLEKYEKLSNHYDNYVRNCDIGNITGIVTKYIKFKKVDENKTEISLRFNPFSIYNHDILSHKGDKIAISNAYLLVDNKKIKPDKKIMIKDYFHGEKIDCLDQATYIVDRAIDNIGDELKFEFELVNTEFVRRAYNGALEYSEGINTKDDVSYKKIMETYKPYIIKQLKYSSLSRSIKTEESDKKDIEAFEQAYKKYVEKNKNTNWDAEANKIIEEYSDQEIGKFEGLYNGFIKENNKLKIRSTIMLDGEWEASEKEFNSPKKIKDVIIHIQHESGNVVKGLDFFKANMSDKVTVKKNGEDEKTSISDLEDNLTASMANGLPGQGAALERCGQIVKRADKYFLKVKMNDTFTATEAFLNGRIAYLQGSGLSIPKDLTSNLAKKTYSTVNKTKRACEEKGAFLEKAYEGYVYDEAEIELDPYEFDEDAYNHQQPDDKPYEEEDKRWEQNITVCVEAMEYGYVPSCTLYISDMKNYKGFNYKNYSKLDNFRKNMYNAFYIYERFGKIWDYRSKIFKEKTDIFTEESMIKVRSFMQRSKDISSINKTFPDKSYEETEKIVEKIKEDIKGILVRRDGREVTDDDIDFLNFGMDKINSYPDEMPYTPIDADMSKSTAEPYSEESEEEDVSVDSVAINNKDLQIEKGKSYKLEVNVVGKNLKEEDKKVDWTLVGDYDKATTIDSEGNLQVSNSEVVEKIKVKATSKKDSSKFNQVDFTIKKSVITPVQGEDLKKYDENNNNIVAKPIYEDIDYAYEIPVSLISHNDNKFHSMAEEALANEKKMIITEKNGVKKAYLVFDKRTVAGGIEGRLTKLFTFKDNKIETKNANDILCDMISYKKGKYLGGGIELLFPHVFSMNYINFKEGENTIYLKVNVDAMDAGGEGSGQQITDLKFNTNKKESLTIDSLKEKYEKFNHPKHMKIISKDKKTSISIANVEDNAKLNVGISTSKDNEKLKEVSAKVNTLPELKGKEVSRLIHTSIPKDTSIGNEPILTYQIDCENLKNFNVYFVDGSKLESIKGLRKVGNTLIFNLSKLGDVIVVSDAKSPTPNPEPSKPNPEPSKPNPEPSKPDTSKTEETNKDLAYYEVPVRLMHVGKTEYADNTLSMGDNALNKTAIVKVEKGRPTYQIKFNSLDFMNLHGHVTKLFAFDEKVQKGSDMTPNPNGRKTEMRVLRYTEDESLIKGLKKKFPEVFEFSRNEREDEVYVRVNVDAMDSLSSVGKSGKLGDVHSYDEIKQGAGAQSAILRFDWNNAKKIDKSNFVGSSNYGEEDEDKAKVEEKGRIFGDDRYETSVEISKSYFKKADKVILASGMNNADALVAASYADLSKAPILLTKTNDLPSHTMAEIERLNASEVVIVGGNASVSYSVDKKLKDKGLTVSRVSGSDRFATSMDLAKKLVDNKASNKLVLINGYKNTDALTVSSLATSESIPVIMTDGNNISNSVKKFIKDNDIKEVIIVGGNSSMSESMMKQLNVKTRRIAGKDRFETAIKIADEIYPDLKNVIIANGYNSIDALSAGAITNIAKAPILLTNRSSIPSSVKYKLKGLNDNRIIVVGGKSTITNSMYKELMN
nr:cell wall-binding repeat-containing protein [uncultured Peptostreptococcus sp.]